MLTAIIIDDEVKGRLALKEKLKTYCPGVTLLAEAGSGPEGIAAIEKYNPQVVFLDIEMPGMNGFDMLLQLPGHSFRIIFTTAYDQYAIKAIKYAAFDYLLKPVDIEELQAAIQKVQSFQVNQMEAQLQLLKDTLQSSPQSFSRLAIPTQEGLFFYRVHDIVCLEASSNYTTLYFNNGKKVTASKTLKELEEMLPSAIFFRAHHSWLINLHFIKKYVRGDGGQVEMENGLSIEVSRRKKEEFLRLIRHK